MMDGRLEYIHQNRVKAGYVKSAEHDLYISAKDYADEKGLIKITKQ